jgi:hypothetical protein
MSQAHLCDQSLTLCKITKVKSMLAVKSKILPLATKKTKFSYLLNLTN